MPIIGRDIPTGPDPWQVAPPEYEWPFLHNGDSVSFIVTRFYKQRVADYNADRLAGRYMPGVHQDPDHAGAYMIGESKADRTATALVAFTRTFARVPLPQVEYSSLVLTKPPFPENDYLGAWISSTDITVTAQVWSPVVAITSRAFQPTGGTLTVKVTDAGTDTFTAAINFGDSNAAVATTINNELIARGLALRVSALNGLAGSGTITLTKTAGSGIVSVLSFGDNSLTPACVVSNSGTPDTTLVLYAARTSIAFTSVAHNLTAGQSIRYMSGSTGGGTPDTVESVTSADVFTLANSSAISPPNPSGFRTLMRTYTPGPDRVISEITESFYLPGVTPGIATPKDIPVPDVAINEVELLELIVALATGFQTYDSDPIERWPNAESPIYAQRLIKINVDNL